ncbi:MAG: hypothetical protein FJX77_05565 [Armatimonadetes bacterium]|nr:hypothetical protein [Armatimonadota bacterium]
MLHLIGFCEGVFEARASHPERHPIEPFVNAVPSVHYLYGYLGGQFFEWVPPQEEGSPDATASPDEDATTDADAPGTYDPDRPYQQFMARWRELEDEVAAERAAAGLPPLRKDGRLRPR